MSRRVEEILRERGQAAYERLKVLKYLMLVDDLRERGGAATATADDLAARLAVLSELSLEDLARLGTPFFWLNARRLYDRAHQEAERLAEVSRYLVAQAFDAYFAQLPDGAAVELSGTSEEHLLPRLGLRIPARGSAVRLERLDRQAVAIDLGGSRTRVDLADVPAAWRLPRWAIAGEPSLLLEVRSPALYDAEHLPLLAPASPRAATLAATLATALAVIRLGPPGLAEQIRSLIGFYAPLAAPKHKNHHSFSAPRLIGVIFLSEAYDDLRLVEALVHEYHHNELSLLMEVEPVLAEEPGELFYSPWRDDPRPLYGLVQAIHVFTGVIDFYRHAERAVPLARHQGEFRARRQEICSQLRLGLVQVPDRRLTPLGREIIAGVDQEVADHEAELGLSGVGLPPLLADHLRAWRRRNATLAAVVRT
jgi:HEXXH motif-containing protein